MAIEFRPLSVNLNAALNLLVLEIDGMHVEASSTEIRMWLMALQGEAMHRWQGREPSSIPELQEARRLYRVTGTDPTRTRPSSEALLRRTLKGQELYSISNAVDICNGCSLELLLPLGLYDRATLDAPLEARLGLPGESYPGIRKDEVHLEGRLGLFDRKGPFGSPTSDSLRSSVTSSTHELLLVIYSSALRLAAAMLDLGRHFAAHFRHLGDAGGIRACRVADTVGPWVEL